MDPRFFCPGAELQGVLTLSEGDHHHIQRVLRLRPGDGVVVCDGAGQEAVCRLNNEWQPVVLSVAATDNELPIAAHIFASLAKGERFEWMLQKSVELGAASITPVVSARCIVPPPDGKKRERWARIMRQAAEQSGRGRLPELRETLPYLSAIADTQTPGIFCYENTEKHSLKDEFSRMRNPSAINIFTGPEGGFTPIEAQSALNYGYRHVSLGKRILRCETAPLFVLTALQYAFVL